VDLLVELVVELACHVQANTNSKLGSGTDLGGVGCSTAHASRGGARQLFLISKILPSFQMQTGTRFECFGRACHGGRQNCKGAKKSIVLYHGI